jgi:hypothetical protein
MIRCGPTSAVPLLHRHLSVLFNPVRRLECTTGWVIEAVQEISALSQHVTERIDSSKSTSAEPVGICGERWAKGLASGRASDRPAKT